MNQNKTIELKMKKTLTLASLRVSATCSILTLVGSAVNQLHYRQTIQLPHVKLSNKCIHMHISRNNNKLMAHTLTLDS